MAAPTKIPTEKLTKEQLEAMPRSFWFNGAELADPDEASDENEVKKYWSQIHPQLTNASVSMEVKNGIRQYTFKAAIGTKG